MSEPIIAYLRGGLGNQLFIYAAALTQSRRLKCPLNIDSSHYLIPNRRHFSLQSLKLEGDVIEDASPWLGTLPVPSGGRRDRLRYLAHRHRVVRRKIYEEPFFHYSKGIDSITAGTTLYGYFQSWRYFAPVASSIAEMLFEQPVIAQMFAGGSPLPEGAIALHVRRGDYTKPAVTDFHGVTTAEYFDRALAFLRKSGHSGEPFILSDDVECASREVGDVLGIPVLDDPELTDPFASIGAMANASALVTSNSSFSWWAAWLGHYRGSLAVICPRPWFKDDRSASDLLLPEWITLDARELR